jgi:hypothetical protein
MMKINVKCTDLRLDEDVCAALVARASETETVNDLANRLLREKLRLPADPPPAQD